MLLLCGTEAAVSKVFAWSFFAEKTPQLKIGTDGGMEAAVSKALAWSFAKRNSSSLKSARMPIALADMDGGVTML